MLALCTLSCCCLCIVCSNVSEALICLPCVFSSVLACVQSVQMFQKLSCLPYVFGSVLACVQSVEMFWWLLYLLYDLYPAVACVQSVQMFQKLSCLPHVSGCLICFADFVSVSSLITVPQTVTLFYISLRSQAPQRQYTVCSFSSMRRNGHSHKLTSSRALRYYTVGIPWFLGQR